MRLLLKRLFRSIGTIVLIGLLFYPGIASSQEDPVDEFLPEEAVGEINESLPEDAAISEQEILENLTMGIKNNANSISLDLKGMNVVELLRMLALKTGLTIVPSKGVSGRINIFLNNVSFQEALDIILVTQNLASERKGDVIYITTAAEYKRLYGKDYVENREHKNIKLQFADPANVFAVLSQLKSEIGKVIVDKASGMVILIDIPEKLEVMESAVKKLETPLEMAVFELNYAKPEEIKAGLNEIITPGTGKIIFDERSSQVIVYDLPEKMDKIERIVKSLDAEEKEVFIEADIVQVTLSDRYQKGIDWEMISGGNNDLVSAFPLTPTPANLGKISIGTLAGDDYTAVLELLRTQGDIKILSNPKLAVVNNQEARILVGTRDAYVTQTLSQAESTTVTSENIEFIDVGVKLNVVPKINNDGFITMTIKPEVSNVAETITTSLGSRIPIVETSEVETVVKVKDNTMIMIAGLRKDEKRDQREGVPGLEKLPFLGGLFRSRDQSTRQTEIIVFITPHIITGAEASPEGYKREFMGNKQNVTEAKEPSGDIFLEELGLVNSLPEDEGGEEDIMENDDFDFEDQLKGIK
ncbi:MAG: secretin N-terminal domain-containing protein [Candidatus Omnitrophota bacterium]